MRVIPVEHETKKPYVKGWNTASATGDPATIGRYWQKWRDANAGVGCVSPDIVILDVAPRRNGNATIARRPTPPCDRNGA
ncbi:MAG: bifunctional DNA primase/polymerase [Chloroflexota bacterium]|nr:bifunctional DNA primase/polymerase [Chloroflexota bacterium]